MAVDERSAIDGRYDLERVIGRGGMADVYRATDRILSRRVAVKVLRDVASSESDRLRFASEARTLAQLSHPSLITVLDAGSAEDRPYLVMELIDGPSLATVAVSALDSGRVAAIGAQVADALDYVHRAGVVHRDVKPANILLDASGRAWLGDFGIARLVADTARHTSTGLVVGTASYLAPEQLRGGDVTAAADVYALGLVLIESLTGSPVYPGTGIEAAMARLSRSPVIPESLPAEWRSLLEAMTETDPASRPSAAAVASALGDVSGRPSAATAGPSETRVLTAPIETSTSRGRLVWIGGLVAAVAVIVAGAVIVAQGQGRADVPAHRVEMPTNVAPSLQQPLQDLHDALNGDFS